MTTTEHETSKQGIVIERVAHAVVPTVHGDFTAYAYRSVLDGEEHLAYVMGDLRAMENPLVRLHSECLTGDVLASDRCDCGRQLQRSLEMISTEACGVLVYLRGHEGRGIGLSHKIRAYSLQDTEGLDTVDANTAQGLPVDSRDYGVGAAILADLGLSTIRLMTNNPKKVTDLRESGFEIVERIQLEVHQTPANSRYLETKRDRMGHSLP